MSMAALFFSLLLVADVSCISSDAGATAPSYASHLVLRMFLSLFLPVFLFLHLAFSHFVYLASDNPLSHLCFKLSRGQMRFTSGCLILKSQ